MYSLKREDARAMDIKTGGFFDGTQAHETFPFEGRRISLIWYVSKALPRANASLLNDLSKMKFSLPKDSKRCRQEAPRTFLGQIPRWIWT